jgi:hypothetical protein
VNNIPFVFVFIVFDITLTDNFQYQSRNVGINDQITDNV